MTKNEKLIPVLVCQDIGAEHDFLVDALGFSSGGIHRNADGQAVHGEVILGDFVIWLHRVVDEFKLVSPSSMPAASTGLFVYVTDVDAHYEVRSVVKRVTDGLFSGTGALWPKPKPLAAAPL